MNLVPGAPLWLAIFLSLCVVAAAVEDSVRLRISNWTCLAVFAGAILAMALQGFSISLWQNAAVFAVLLGLGTLAFGAGLLGGGDVKLLATLGLLMDFGGAIWLIAAVFLAGGLLGLVYIAARMIRGSKGRDRENANRVPYGVAVAVGALIVFGAQRGLY